MTCTCQKSKIMVVDDNYYSMHIMSMMFKMYCMNKLITVENGQLALEVYQKYFLQTCCCTKIEMIIMDLQMPVMDEFKSAENILALHENMRQDPAYSHIKKPKIYALVDKVW